MIDTIYLDMDGVIADFDKHYSSIYGCNCRDDPNKNNWFDFVVRKGFANLPMCADALLLVQGLSLLDVHIEILSCVSDRSNSRLVEAQKILWLENKGFGSLNHHFTLTKNAKSFFANENSLLIDDSEACTNPFKDAGGYAILHKNAKTSILEINCMIEKGLLCAQSSDQKILIH